MTLPLKNSDIYWRTFSRWVVEFQNFISALKKKASTVNAWHKSKRTKVKMLVIDNVTLLLKKKTKLPVIFIWSHTSDAPLLLSDFIPTYAYYNNSCSNGLNDLLYCRRSLA